MTHYKHKVLRLFTAACLLASTAFIHAEESATTESGSLEAIAETPFRTRDDYTGSTMVIYPSVLNETRVAKGNFSALRFYIAPLCAFIIPDKFKTFPGRTPNEVMYSFEMLNFHPQMESQTKQYVTEQLQSSTDSKFKATGGNISRLTHQQVNFKLPDFPAIKIDPIGTVFEDRSLNNTLKLNMYVPINDKVRFEEMVKAGSVNVDVNIYYIGKNVKIASMSWSAADIKETAAYKKIDSSGAQFVNAQQLDDMVRETVQRKDITIFQDPGIPEQLTAKVQNMFDKFLDIQGETAMFIKNQDEARQIEKEILAGTGLTAEEFKPITMMWEITEQLKDETDYKKANQKMQEYMRDKSERSKIATDIHMSTSASADADLGFVKASASASTSANFSYENEKTKHDVDQGYFASQEALNEFRSKNRTERGMEPRITPRGLNLVETKKFKDNLSIAASAVAYYPVDKARQLGITGTFTDKITPPEVLTLQQRVDALENRKPSPPNILVNSNFMVPTDAKNPNGLPAGWFIHGTGTANSVSKFTKGFVGIYAVSKAATYLNPSDANSATESSPVYYDQYNTGPRIGRDGWRAGDYKLVNFKSGPAGDTHSVLCQSRHQSTHDQHSTYHFQMYIKFISGSRFGIQQDVAASTNTISRGDCDKSPQGWCKFEGDFYGSQTDNVYLCMGRPGASSEDVEVLIALPYIYSQNALWVDSVDTVPTPTP